MSDAFGFLQQFVRQPRAVGAIAPSSRFLAAAMVDWIDWTGVRAVAEYGPGTGAFTQFIADAVRPDARYFAVERNPSFAAALRARFPHVPVVNDSVENIQAICRDQQVEQLDAIICGLPWASFTNDQQSRYLDSMKSVMSPHGKFATFAYLQGLLLPAGQRFRRRLRRQFRRVHTSPVVWRNLPPAFVYRCTN